VKGQRDINRISRIIEDKFEWLVDAIKSELEKEAEGNFQSS
jgi:hypothetical protein